MKVKKVVNVKKNIKSVLMISLLVLKYLMVYLLFSFLQGHRSIMIYSIVSVILLFIDIFVICKEKDILEKKSVLIYLVKYLFIFTVLFDFSLIISLTMSEEFTNIIINLVAIIIYSCILIDFMLLPMTLSKWKRNEDFTLKEKVKVIIVYWTMPLIIFYCILSSYEEIFIPIFSGVIYVFLKWFYSKDFLQYMRAKTENEFEISEEEFGISEERFEISEELEKSNAIKSSNITILFTAINLSALIKKICESQFIFISDKLTGLTKLNLAKNFIPNLFAVVLVTILFFVIKTIIYKKGVSIIQKYKIKQKYRIENSN